MVMYYNSCVKQRARWWAWLGAAIGGGIGVAVGLAVAEGDLDKLGDWRNGAARFVGLTGALGLFAGYVILNRATRGKRVTRDGFTVSFRPNPPTPEGYRDMKVVAVADLISGLMRVGYAPGAEACDEAGVRRGSIDDKTPLQGANIAVSDPGVRGWIRVALAPWMEGRPGALGLVEIWSEGGESAEELALFTLRVLGGLFDDVAAARETSRLGQDPVALVTAGLGERPQHRAP